MSNLDIKISGILIVVKLMLTSYLIFFIGYLTKPGYALVQSDDDSVKWYNLDVFSEMMTYSSIALFFFSVCYLFAYLIVKKRRSQILKLGSLIQLIFLVFPAIYLSITFLY